MILKYLLSLKQKFWIPTRPRYRESNAVYDAIAAFQSLNETQYASVFNNEYSTIKIRSMYANVELYLAMIEKIKDGYTYNQLLPASSYINLTTTQIYIRDFFISNGYYLDPVLNMETFKHACIELLELFNALEHDPQRSFENDHNLRITGHVVRNIMDLSTQIKID